MSSTLREDPVSGRWVIISSSTAEQSEHNFVSAIEQDTVIKCPFCYGSEHMTPAEVWVYREDRGKPNTAGWLARVVPNRFPALKIEGQIEKQGIGIYDTMTGIGAHEVIIESPDHTKQMADFSEEQIQRIIRAYRDRILDLKQDKRFKYILIFKNYGLQAGATLTHSHSQLIALPIVPKRVTDEIAVSEKYFSSKERCVFCDIIKEELRNFERVVLEYNNFIAFAPFASRFPFEICIAPKHHLSDFTSINQLEITELGSMLKDILARIKQCLSNPAYNFLIHTSPLNLPNREDYHWHIEIMPRILPISGFEWGSGFYINPISPENATKCLRK